MLKQVTIRSLLLVLACAFSTAATVRSQAQMDVGSSAQVGQSNMPEMPPGTWVGDIIVADGVPLVSQVMINGVIIKDGDTVNGHKMIVSPSLANDCVTIGYLVGNTIIFAVIKYKQVWTGPYNP